MAQLDKLFELMIRESASDLHIATGSPPVLRVHGELRRIEIQALKHEQNLAMFAELMNERAKEDFKKRKQADFVYEIANVARFRANVYLERHGVSGSFRIIPSKVLSAQELQLPDAIVNLCRLKKGLVLVTGPTGSGKSTTLAAMMDHCNQTRKDHIITVEDPIEFVHPNKTCLVSQRQVGEHVDSFSDALRAALREDPDIILVGEMRDLETISLAITAAETGHLVFGTLHTSSAAKTVDRIIDAFPVSQQEQIRTILSESLKGVIAQILLKRSDIKGRVAAYEILLGTPALANLIRDAKTFQIPSLMQTQRGTGMRMMDQSLLDLVKQHRVAAAEAIEYAVDKKMFATGLEGGAGVAP
jgi:twitching motility protein PilT